jgi:hypothetical protein
VNSAVFAVIEPKFLEPVVQVLEHLEPVGSQMLSIQNGLPRRLPQQRVWPDGAFGAIRDLRHRKEPVVKSKQPAALKSDNPRNAARAMFLTAAELCRHGFNVTPTSRNMAGADLLITDDRCRNTWTIQVKVTDQTYKKRRGWLIGRNAKRTAHATHAYVFVLLQGDRRPDFYVVPSGFVEPMQFARQPIARQHPRPDAKNFGAEVSF